MRDEATLARLRALKPSFKGWNLERVRLFGSRARGDFADDSDVDLLVEFSEVPSLFTLCDIQHSFENELGKKVDLVFADKIFPEIREKILSEAQDV